MCHFTTGCTKITFQPDPLAKIVAMLTPLARLRGWQGGSEGREHRVGREGNGNGVTSPVGYCRVIRYYCNMVGWAWWDWEESHPPSVLWHCWLGHL